MAELQQRPRARLRAASPRGKGLGFTVELAPDARPTIVTDPGRLRQVLKNLLSNAFKFTEQRRGAVSVGMAGPRLELRRARRSPARMP